MTEVNNKEKIIYINYFDIIDEPRTNVIMKICTELIAKQNPDALYFLFSSPGGSVNAGIVLYNFLKALPVKVVMHNTGSIDSIALVIFLAGKERYSASHSTFLLHGVKNIFPQGASLTLSQLLERKSQVEQDENKIAGIISSNTQLSDSELRSLFRQGESKGLDFAKEKGLIHDIRDPLIPKGEPFLTVSINVN